MEDQLPTSAPSDSDQAALDAMVRQKSYTSRLQT
jgi:hypothetical protein